MNILKREQHLNVFATFITVKAQNRGLATGVLESLLGRLVIGESSEGDDPRLGFVLLVSDGDGHLSHIAENSALLDPTQSIYAPSMAYDALLTYLGSGIETMNASGLLEDLSIDVLPVEAWTADFTTNPVNVEITLTGSTFSLTAPCISTNWQFDKLRTNADSFCKTHGAVA